MDVDIYNTVVTCTQKTPSKDVAGFTLLELVITLAISAIVLLLAIPSLATLIQNSRLTTAVNDLASSLYLTRSEAIKRNRPAVICKGTASSGCDKTREWQNGWLMFIDSNNDKLWSDDEPLIHSHDALPYTLSVRWSAFPSSSYVVYYPNGTASSNGTFTFCDERGSEAAKALIISRVGRVRFSRKSAAGAPLECPS